MHAGDDRVKKARVQALRREFDWLSMKESEVVGEFALKLTSMVNVMRALGSKIEVSVRHSWHKAQRSLGSIEGRRKKREVVSCKPKRQSVWCVSGAGYKHRSM